MPGIKKLAGFGLVFVLMATTTFAMYQNEGDLYDKYKNIRYLMETKRSIVEFKNLIDDLHNRLEKKAACILDGGFSSSCDHRDAVEAGQHHRFLASSFAPGRRKRNSFLSSSSSLPSPDSLENVTFPETENSKSN